MDGAVITDRHELPARPRVAYVFGVDPSGAGARATTCGNREERSGDPGATFALRRLARVIMIA